MAAGCKLNRTRESKKEIQDIMIKLPESSAVKARVMRILRPSSKLGRATLYIGGLSVLFIALGWITGPRSGSKLSGWATFVTVVFAFCAMLLTLRWAGRIIRPSSKLGRATLWVGGLSVLFIALGWITGPRSGSKLSGWATFVTVVFAFCAMLLTLRWAGRIIRPSSKLGRATLWVGGLSVFFIALGWITGPRSGSKLSGWATFVTVVFAFCALLLTFRWAWRHLMWRLRHRLIVTYIFIGVIPIVLLLLMAGVGSYLFAGQFATYIAISNLQSALQHLEAANDALATQLSTLERSGKLNQQIAGELVAAPTHFQAAFSVALWTEEEAPAGQPEVAGVEAGTPLIRCSLKKEDLSNLWLSVWTACMCRSSERSR